jgi:hypothetical protein
MGESVDIQDEDFKIVEQLFAFYTGKTNKEA